MAQSNHERVGRALELLSAGLRPFVEREMRVVHGEGWQDVARQIIGTDKYSPRDGLNWDVANLLRVMWDEWNNVFAKTLGKNERNLVAELREIRNAWAHQKSFDTDDAYRALDTMERLLEAVSAEQSAELTRQKAELLRVRFDEQVKGAVKKAETAAVSGRPQEGLKPWRMVVTPHPDVASGMFRQAEFAADLWQVYRKEGEAAYRDPVEFFKRTFLTGGLSNLLSNALRRLSGSGGDPVVELQTNFGGGKTHSMLALFHMFSGVPMTSLPGLEPLLKGLPAGTPEIPCSRAVFVGTKINPGQIHEKPDGTRIRTIWGELAWQLGGAEGYSMVADADRMATNPGEALRELFNRFAPCLILIDEWVAYARQLRDDSDFPAGSFDTQFTFVQALSEEAKAADRTLLVVSIPSSENEAGGEWGQTARSRLQHAIGRVESSWRPATSEEGFEIVRRRLFDPITDPEMFKARDAVARAFVNFYAQQQAEFPQECREAGYEERIKAAYPIHPELFNRLFNDWSTLDRFQHTRGVLRLMASVIHSLWEREDGNLLIMPASIPLDEASVKAEMMKYLSEGWAGVIEKDVDSENSLSRRIDAGNPNLGRFSTARRVARTVFIGSAPLEGASNKGIDDRSIKLGSIQPGETVAVVGDALRRLYDSATYLYGDGGRFWFSTQPTLNRLADDRARQIPDDKVASEIEDLLRQECRQRGDFVRIHVCVQSGDVPDETDARLVVLGPSLPHIAKSTDSRALVEAGRILEYRGSSLRHYRNSIVFLAADEDRLKDLQGSVRRMLAWHGIGAERESLNLDAAGCRQVESQSATAKSHVMQQLPMAYSWLLVPSQGIEGPITWSETRLSGTESLAARAGIKLRGEDSLIVKFGSVCLRRELDRIPLWRGDHVTVQQLEEDFARYLYLPRLRDRRVLHESISEGVANMNWRAETFAVAESFDAVSGKYLAVHSGSLLPEVRPSYLVVRPEVAERLLDVADGKPGPDRDGENGKNGQDADEHKVSPDRPRDAVPADSLPTSFHGSVEIRADRLIRDASQIAEEVVTHLLSLPGANVRITLEIDATAPDGIPAKTRRDIDENCTALHFTHRDFEE